MLQPLVHSKTSKCKKLADKVECIDGKTKFVVNFAPFHFIMLYDGRHVLVGNGHGNMIVEPYRADENPLPKKRLKRKKASKLKIPYDAPGTSYYLLANSTKNSNNNNNNTTITTKQTTNK